MLWLPASRRSVNSSHTTNTTTADAVRPHKSSPLQAQTKKLKKKNKSQPIGNDYNGSIEKVRLMGNDYGNVNARG